MLYRLLKIPAKFAFWIYCRKIKVNNSALFNNPGPLLIASNHPNSFLDAIILATLFKQPVHSLARGDAFTNKINSRLLTSLLMLPVYRITEGAENLEHNYMTFEKCKQIFKQKGLVLIFSEGRCVNEWHLRRLKKGTARLAISAWNEGIPLKVLPVGINYNSFSVFGKNIQLNFGNPITSEYFDANNTHGKSISDFNIILEQQLKDLVIEADKQDQITIREKFYAPQSLFKRTILFFPSILGWLFHFAFFLPLKNFAWKRAAHNDHYDSVMIGLLFILYPFYLLLISFLCFILFRHLYWILVFPILPFFAWSHVQLKDQF